MEHSVQPRQPRFPKGPWACGQQQSSLGEALAEGPELGTGPEGSHLCPSLAGGLEQAVSSSTIPEAVGWICAANWQPQTPSRLYPWLFWPGCCLKVRGFYRESAAVSYALSPALGVCSSWVPGASVGPVPAE